MKSAMWAALLALLAMLAIARLAVADEKEDAEVRALLAFIIDVESYKDGFYGVYDYCGPKTHPDIAKQSLDDWNVKYKALLAAQALAEQEFFKMARARGAEVAAREKLKQVKVKVYKRMHDGDGLYRSVLAEEDKVQACAKRLGAMLSDSMSFESVAPESYQYWRTHYTH